MNIGSVHAGKGPEPIHPQESQSEKQKLFDIQFETSVIGMYVAVSQKNGNISHQLETIKKGMKAGEKPEKLVPAMNHLIDEINKDIPSGKATFPPFELTAHHTQFALQNYARTLEKFFNVAAEKGKISWSHQEELFKETSALWAKLDEGNIPMHEAKNNLNAIIEQANQHLPQEFQLKPLG